MGISFELAWKNPIGNITDGITRTSTDVSIFNLDNKIKNNRLGGADPWNTKKYLNIKTL